MDVCMLRSDPQSENVAAFCHHSGNTDCKYINTEMWSVFTPSSVFILLSSTRHKIMFLIKNLHSIVVIIYSWTVLFSILALCTAAGFCSRPD